MNIQFYNTLTNSIEPFKPLNPPDVRMYNCGLTVYDYGHIGNFRAFVFADVLRRFLEFAGYNVIQVMNITDVGHMTEDQLVDGGGQDKMALAAERLKQSKQQGVADVQNPEDPYQVAQYFTNVFLEDARMLGLKIADEYPQRMPKATEHVGQMIKLIQSLIEKGHAYVTAEGTVYFDIQSFPNYGSLSNNTLDHLDAGKGGRVTDAQLESKKHPADFLLWKTDEKHLMKWESPWGTGYPGWHIECSAMALDLHQVDTIDIHTGGEDNIFPHHECEIAQSTGATGKPFSQFWMHTRFLLVEGEKMSKSKGNFYTVRDLLNKNVPPVALRYELMKTHYRKNMDFSMKGLCDSNSALKKLRDFAATHPDVTPESYVVGDTEIEQQVLASLSDDLNISKALGEIFTWINNTPQPTEADVLALKRIDHVLNVLNDSVAIDIACEHELTDEMINEKIEALKAARVAKDYAAADAIRDELTSNCIAIQMSKDGITWERKMQVK